MLDGFDHFKNFDSNMKSFFESYEKFKKLTPEEREARQRNYLKWKKIETFEKRLAHSYNNRDYLEPNCYGTAFYLMGILPYDQVIFTDGNVKRIRRALALMEEHSEPVADSIMISFNEKNKLSHASFILTINPILGYHREGSGCRLEKILDIEKDVVKSYLIPIVGMSSYTNKFFTVNGNSLEDWAKEITAEYYPLWYG